MNWWIPHVDDTPTLVIMTPDSTWQFANQQFRSVKKSIQHETPHSKFNIMETTTNFWRCCAQCSCHHRSSYPARDVACHLRNTMVVFSWKAHNVCPFIGHKISRILRRNRRGLLWHIWFLWSKLGIVIWEIQHRLSVRLYTATQKTMRGCMRQLCG